MRSNRAQRGQRRSARSQSLSPSQITKRPASSGFFRCWGERGSKPRSGDMPDVTMQVQKSGLVCLPTAYIEMIAHVTCARQ